MHDMTHRRRLAALCAVAGVALGTTGCSAEGGTATRQEDPANPSSCELATVNGDLAFTPQVDTSSTAWTSCRRATCGSRWSTRSATSSRRGAAGRRGVAAGKYDLGVVGTQVFDTLGVTSFRP